MKQSRSETSYPTTSFGPLVDLGVQIANTFMRLRLQAQRQRQAS